MQLLALALGLLSLAPAPPASGGHKDGFAAIEEDDVERHLLHLASAPLEGRDSPSAGLARAAEYVAAHLREAGFTPLPDRDSFLWEFVLFGPTPDLPVPVEEACRLTIAVEEEEPVELAYGVDFVPTKWAVPGRVEGPPAFLGYGISSPSDRYDELRGRPLDGRVAIILEGEPRHRRAFEGEEEVTGAADLYGKLKDLEEHDVAAVLVVRRPPEATKEVERAEIEAARLGYRYTWASWAGEPARRPTRVGMPVLEVTVEAASRILGEDVGELAEKIDRRGRPGDRVEPEDRIVSVATDFRTGEVVGANVVGVLAGSDPELADQWVIVGAHYDHVGVDPRGRIGYGADDNASGTSALLEIADALGQAKPRRSVLAIAFAGEEDGLLGSRAICATMPVPAESVVAMVNMDMIGRGERREVVALGPDRNEDLEDLVERAADLRSTGIRDVRIGKAQELWERSDHHPFHEIGIPVVFYFEQANIAANRDYHTWRDTIELVDVEKVTSVAKLAFNTVWLLADDDEPPSRER